MPMYDLIEYRQDYSKTSGILRQYCRDEPAVDNDGAITDFSKANIITDSFNLKIELSMKQATMVQKMLK